MCRSIVPANYLFVLSVIKASLKHSIDNGLQSGVDFLPLLLGAVNVFDALFGVEVDTFGCTKKKQRTRYILPLPKKPIKNENIVFKICKINQQKET